jgi:hypothetical protein
MHIHRERVGLIQAGSAVNHGMPGKALLVTSLLPRVRLIMLNASVGDQAELVERPCGCPLESLGWSPKMHSVRSFEKLTAGGMTFFDTDAVKALDEVLPSRFGGDPTDFQLVDHEEPDGRPVLQLLVHPRLGTIDEGAVRDTFLQAIGPGAGAERLMAQVWQQAGLPTVVRTPPRAVAGGKIQHVHYERAQAGHGGGRRATVTTPANAE